jgi:two-component system cell cycle sensor histidine kinase/response regulator CckA
MRVCLLDNVQFLPEKTRQIYSHLPAVFFASIVNAIILSYILWNEVPHQKLNAWLAAVLAVTLLRQLSFQAYNKSENKEAAPHRWISRYLAGLFLSGLLWGSAGILIFPEPSVSHQIFIAFVLGGMVAGSIASTSILRFGFYLFSIPALLPIIVRFLLLPDDIHFGMGIMCMIFLGCCLFIAGNFHSSTVALLKLRHQNEQEIKRRRQSEKALVRHKDELEKVVSERTQDLERINEELRLEIAERQKTEKALQESENRLKKVLETLPVGVWFTDKKGKIIYGNPAGQKIWQGAHYIGPDDFHVYKAWWKDTGEPITPEQWGVARAIKNREESHEEEIEIECFDGTHKTIQNWAAPILNINGEVEGALAVNHDITEKKALEEEQQKIKKLESIGTLAGGIAHDFNNILAAILGNINLALLDTDLNERTKSLLVEAEKASLRAKELTQQLLTFAKGGDPVKEASSLESIIKDSANFILRGDKVACQYDIPEDLWMVDVDKGQISQVIQNIVLNASHAMPEGGVVAITCENVIAGIKEALPFALDQRLVKIRIQDRGIGIPQNVLEKIFDPYFSTKAKSSGLGLAITQSIVNKHSGHISVESSPGEGSTFTIYLPALEQVTVQQQELLKEIEPSSQAKVLIMDDDDMVRNMTKEMLMQLGHEVTLTTNGEEAIQLYQESMNTGSLFDLVIMDLTIPGRMGGKEAVNAVLKIDPRAKVIVSSGYSNDPIITNYKDYGFCAAIVKPFQLQDLSKVISQSWVEPNKGT